MAKQKGRIQRNLTDAEKAELVQLTAEYEEFKQMVIQEEAVASAEAAKVKKIKDECEGDLAEAMPLLESALKALDTLTKNDITEVKGMKSPPAGVKLVLEAVCIMRNVKPVSHSLAARNGNRYLKFLHDID